MWVLVEVEDDGDVEGRVVSGVREREEEEEDGFCKADGREERERVSE